MPFKSTAQAGKCWHLKSIGKAGSWDCAKWAKETKGRKLPARKRGKS